MEAVGWVLLPGDLVQRQVTQTWDRYIYLLEVEAENRALRAENKALAARLTTVKEKAADIKNLMEMMQFAPPPQWKRVGARVIGRRFAPDASLSSLLIDQGSLGGVQRDMPVVAPFGVVGRTFRYSLNFSSVLLLTDPAINIAVISEKTRTTGILTGQGIGKALVVNRVPLNAPLEKGEMLLTSGLAGIFPKGLPVAKIDSVHKTDVSLFKEVQACPVLKLDRLENVFVLLPKKARPMPPFNGERP